MCEQRLLCGPPPPPLRFAICLGLLLLGMPRGRVAADEDLPCRREEALTRASEQLVLSGGRPSPVALELAIADAGSDLPWARALRVPVGHEQRLREWIHSFAGDTDTPVVCGQARAHGSVLAVASLRGGTLLARESRVVGSLSTGFRNPELVLRDADDVTLRFAVPRASLRAGVPIDPQLARPVRVQLLATGAEGPVPVAQIILGAGEGAHVPSESTGGPDLDARIQTLRGRGRGASLRQNRLLDGLARDHAAHVCAHDRVAHELQPGQDPERRLRERGIRARLVGEVVARAHSRSAAMDALMRSPSHRMTLADRRFTDVGLGTTEQAEEGVCVVVLLASWPRFVGR